MLRWIEKTRKKPKDVRNKYALAGAIGITFVIAFIWVLSIPTHFKNAEVVQGGGEKDSVSAFSQFFGAAKQNFAAVIQSKDESPVEDEEIAPEEQNVIVPELTKGTIEEALIKKEVSEEPKPRTVLIETVSRDHNSTTRRINLCYYTFQ